MEKRLNWGPRNSRPACLMSSAHLSVTVGLHEFAERSVSFDLELHDGAILACHLQVDVFITFSLHSFLRGDKQGKKTNK